MPQFNYDDRMMLTSEGAMAAAVEILNRIDSAGAFMQDVRECRKLCLSVYGKLVAYNDQFEEE